MKIALLMKNIIKLISFFFIQNNVQMRLYIFEIMRVLEYEYCKNGEVNITGCLVILFLFYSMEIGILQAMLLKKIVLILIFGVVLLQADRKKKDQACEKFQCPKKFRCEDGQCIKQQRQPKKSLCMDEKLKRNIKQVKCEKQRNQKCNPNIRSPTCGVTSEFERIDFLNDCEPCKNPAIVGYYRTTCDSAPQVCLHNQDCINGNCITIFDEFQDRNRKICNRNSDCKQVSHLCIANKCVDKMQLFSSLASKKNSIRTA